MINFKDIYQKLKNPPLWAKVLTYLLALLFSAGSLVLVFLGLTESVIAYIAYALAGVTLTYAVFLFVLVCPKIKAGTIKLLNKWNFTRRLMVNYGFRTVALAVLSFIISIAFGVFNGYLGISLRSIWYGALSAYYVFLAFFRGSILFYHAKKTEKLKDEEQKIIVKARIYRNCGIILLVLNLALSSAIAQMIFNDQGFSYPDWTIFAYAAYAFYKIITSIINLFKAKRHNDLTVQAIRNINFTDASVSILALQTALLHAYTTTGTDISLFNTLTGIAVSVVAYTTAIRMIVVATKLLKKKLSEKEDEQRSV